MSSFSVIFLFVPFHVVDHPGYTFHVVDHHMFHVVDHPGYTSAFCRTLNSPHRIVSYRIATSPNHVTSQLPHSWKFAMSRTAYTTILIHSATFAKNIISREFPALLCRVRHYIFRLDLSLICVFFRN